MEDMRNAYSTSVGNSEGMKPLERLEVKLDDIKIDLK
jgi:hypothetical protein